MNKARAKEAAIAEIENIFIHAGWSDSWGLSDAEIRTAASPLFYRTATPKAAADAKTIINGIGRTIYAVYRVVSPETAYSGNQPHHHNLTVAITIYHDNAYTFAEGSPFAVYLDALYNGLAEKLWALGGGDEEATTDVSDRNPYIFREVIFATNTF